MNKLINYAKRILQPINNSTPLWYTNWVVDQHRSQQYGQSEDAMIIWSISRYSVNSLWVQQDYRKFLAIAVLFCHSN